MPATDGARLTTTAATGGYWCDRLSVVRQFARHLQTIDELRTDVTKTRKDGSRGRLRIDYGEHRDPQAALTWLWKFVLCRAAGYAESARGGPRFPCSAGCGR
jgi:hypothetical protein